MTKTRHPRPARSKPSNVEGHDYDPETGHLTITFRGGRKYRYEGVPLKTAVEFRNASSQGSHLHAHILGKFPVTKI